MPEIQVLVALPAAGEGGFVADTGATGTEDHARVMELLASWWKKLYASKVINVSAEQIAAPVLALAREIGPTLKQEAQSIAGLEVQEISIGCAIDINGSIVIAGLGVEASVVVTFRVT